MVLSRLLLAFIFMMAAGASMTASATAHDKRQHGQTATAQAPAVATPGAAHERMEEHLQDMEKALPKTFSQRVQSWLGRTHPFAVHFPIALFPVSLVALFLARKRGESVELIRAFIVVAGLASVVSAALGWLSGGFVLRDADVIQHWHRWIGTALGIFGGGLALWAWKRREAIASRAMVVGLSLMTAILLVQGWLGAALVHGVNHMNF